MATLVLKYPKLLLMTDYDGTLVPIRERPEFALPSRGLLKALRRLVRNPKVKVAVLSGRDTDDLKKLIPVDGVYLAGCHGAEIVSTGGDILKIFEEKEIAPVLETIAGLALSCVADQDGFLVEKKRTAVALHYRLANLATALQVIGNYITAVWPLTVKNDLEFLAGKKVIEVRPRTVNKGKAVEYLMNLNPEFYPVYIGDDTTDEDAFRTVREKGLGVLVSASKKTTAASYQFRDSRDVLRFLQIIASR